MRRVRLPLLVAALVTVTACSAAEEVQPSVPESTTGAPTNDASPSAAPPSPSNTAPSNTSTPQTTTAQTPTRPATTPPPEPPDLTPEIVARGLEVPWGIAFLPDGSALVAERASADVLRLVPGRGLKRVGTVPGVLPTSEGGLLGLAVSPDFRRDRTVYAYYTTAEDNRVARMTLRGRRLSDPDPILTGIPAGEIHDGGRIAFGPDGKLYVTTGEAGNTDLAQDPDSLGGKILRINADGSVPADNPDPDSPVWTLGHRNVQGITWDSEGRMWATEFGASSWDELNRIERGNNYGWPVNEGRSEGERFTDPVIQWRTGEASPSGVAFVGGSLWVATLQGERIYRLRVRDDGRVQRRRELYAGDYGRLRTAEATPDGDLWFSTSNRDGRGDPAPDDDRIFEISP